MSTVKSRGHSAQVYGSIREIVLVSELTALSSSVFSDMDKNLRGICTGAGLHCCHNGDGR